jgi:hypothetical protein
MASSQETTVGSKFWLQWLLATTIGWTAGLTILVLVPGTTREPILEGLILVAAGVLTSIPQWFLLRRHISRAGRWILASAAGWITSIALSVPYLVVAAWYLAWSEAIPRALIGPVMGIATGFWVGAAVGVLQWLVLRTQVRRPVWWIASSVVGWTAGITIFVLIPETAYGAFFGGVLLSGVGVGAISGAMLVLLLRPPSTVFISLRVRLFATFILLFVAYFLGSVLFFYGYRLNAAMNERTEEIRTLLTIVSAGLDGDELVALYQEGQPRADGLTDDPRYWTQLAWMEKAAGDRPYALYTFVDAETPGEIAFVTDTLARDSDPGAVRFDETRAPAADDPIWDGFTGTTIAADEAVSLSTLAAELMWRNPTTVPATPDRWSDARGAWISGYTPIRNDEGRVVGALGIDLQDTYAAELRAGVLRALVRGIGETLFAMLLMAFLVSRSITKPIVAVTEAARRIGRGEFEQDLSDVRAATFFHHEIDELAEAIEESGRAHLSERHLRKQVAKLKVQINEGRREEQVKEIVEDDFFQELRTRAKEMRAQSDSRTDPDLT